MYWTKLLCGIKRIHIARGYSFNDNKCINNKNVRF